MRHLTILSVFLLSGLWSNASHALDDLQRPASWQIPTADQVGAQLESWLAGMALADGLQQQTLERWLRLPDAATSADLLEHLVRTIGEIEPAAEQFVALCVDGDSPSAPVVSVDPTALERPDMPLWMQRHLRLVYGRWLTDRKMYNEAHQQLHGLSHTDVVDPATLLFYQSVTSHHLIEKDACLESISLLLENESKIPRRYVELARLMQADIQPLEQESLDEISRIMRNIHIRLDLGRAGKRVRTEEEEVLEKLEKMIDKLESQSKEGGGGAQGGGSAPSNPAGDSAPLGGTGPGDVDPKAIGKKSGWGNLPPKERQEALQQISQDFPAHYRDVIEEYFKKLARDVGG